MPLFVPTSKTDYYKHDRRPELIQILAGRGISVCDGMNTPVEPDIALWVQAGEMHQIINTGKRRSNWVVYSSQDTQPRRIWTGKRTQPEKEVIEQLTIVRYKKEKILT